MAPGDSQAGRVFIVTGANAGACTADFLADGHRRPAPSHAGLGFQVSKVLSSEGAHVILTARSEERGIRATKELNDLRGGGAGGGMVEFMPLDMASFSSIQDFAAAFLQRGLPLHGLLANAGVFCPPFGRTEQGFEVSVGVKHFGHTLLLQLLRGKLVQSAPSRVVFMSGSAEQHAKMDWSDLGGLRVMDSGMGQAARANLYVLMAAVEWNRRLAESGVDVFACHPGFTKTEFTGKMASDSIGRRLFRVVVGAVAGLKAQPVESGALSMLHAATAPELKGQGGTYWGPHYSSNKEHTVQRQPKHPLATDPAACKRLVEETEAIIKAVQQG